MIDRRALRKTLGSRATRRASTKCKALRRERNLRPTVKTRMKELVRNAGS